MSEKDLSTRVYELYKLLFFIFILNFLLFQNALSTILGIPSFVDEIIQAIMLMLIGLSCFRNKNARFILKVYILLFFVFMAFSVEAFSHRGLSNVVQQIFVHLKYVVYLGFFSIFMDRVLLDKVVRFYFIATLFFLVVNILLPVEFTALLEQTLKTRFGIARPIGIQGQTGNLGYTAGLYCIYFICQKSQQKEIVKYLKAFLFFIIVTLTTVRTALIVFPLVLLWRFKQSFKLFSALLILGLILFFSIGTNKIADEVIAITEQNFESMADDPSKTAYIRGMMIYFAFDLANDRFPIGTGASTFGTVKSDNSAIYTEIGMQDSRFFIEKEGIYDSNFASLLGEFGYIGALIYYIFFILICLKVSEFYGYRNTTEFKFVFFVFFTIYSVTGPVFMNTYQIVIFIIILLAAAHKKITRETPMQIDTVKVK